MIQTLTPTKALIVSRNLVPDHYSAWKQKADFGITFYCLFRGPVQRNLSMLFVTSINTIYSNVIWTVEFSICVHTILSPLIWFPQSCELSLFQKCIALHQLIDWVLEERTVLCQLWYSCTASDGFCLLLEWVCVTTFSEFLQYVRAFVFGSSMWVCLPIETILGEFFLKIRSLKLPLKTNLHMMKPFTGNTIIIFVKFTWFMKREGGWLATVTYLIATGLKQD